MHLYFTGIFPIFFDDSIAIKGKNQRENKGTRRFLMKRKLVMLATAMMILVLAAPAWAEFVDFTSGATSGSGLTITAKSNVNTNWNPWATGANGGIAASVYSGNLGDLGVTGQSYVGLGVGANSTDGAITYREALVFTFDQPQNSNQLGFTILGLNAYSPSGTQDNLRVYYKVASGEIASVDVNSGAIASFGPDYASAIRYGLQYANYADARVTAFAVEQTYGNATTNVRKFGVGSITYDAPTSVAVPEPFTLLLLGAGLIGIAGIRRFRK
jgi:hypothetical protein